ncbi:MAG: MoxR family ATPase [Lachnospiraceae bacterium]|nr:MoxR family ATPase [Lachnospiraceae bacterium]
MDHWDKILLFKKAIHEEFIGKEEVIEHLLTCLFAGGHVLLEDVPGIGKTTLAKVLAGAAGLSLGRVQFTPDTLPSDVVGVNVYDMKTGEFHWKQGAVMNQILLADEINRTQPKTQSSLLEVMAEGQVSVDGKSYPLPAPFMVIATENPIEYMGTYPLPEAQMDRFMMKLSLGYPEREQELLIARHALLKEQKEAELVWQNGGQTPGNGGNTVGTVFPDPVMTAADLFECKKMVTQVKVSEQVLAYIEDIITATRTEERFRLGGSTRAYLALMKASQARAFLQKRDYVTPDDVKTLVIPVLAHRTILTTEAKRQRARTDKVLLEVLSRVRVPV